MFALLVCVLSLLCLFVCLVCCLCLLLFVCAVSARCCRGVLGVGVCGQGAVWSWLKDSVCVVWLCGQCAFFREWWLYCVCGWCMWLVHCVRGVRTLCCHGQCTAFALGCFNGHQRALQWYQGRAINGGSFGAGTDNARDLVRATRSTPR